jgi:hypothetical protein
MKLIKPPGYWDIQSNSEKSSFIVILIYENGGRDIPLAEISCWFGVFVLPPILANLYPGNGLDEVSFEIDILDDTIGFICL